GARDAVMTIWSVVSGNAVMRSSVDEPVVTEGSATRLCSVDPRPHSWSRPGKRTTDQGRFLTSRRTIWSALTVAGTAPDFRRLPFEPLPPSEKLVSGTLVAGVARRAVKLRSSELRSPA